MIEILPNWHPAFVHFTVALLSISTLLFVAVRLGRDRGWAGHAKTAAYWNLWLGAALTVLTVLAGVYAYNTVQHDTPSHAAMTDHRNWALATAIIFWGLALWAARTKRAGGDIGTGFLAILVVATGLLGVTGWKGGEVVYRYGLGVMSLPEVSADSSGADTGDGHDHDHGEAASPEAMPETMPEAMPGAVPESATAPTPQPAKAEVGGHAHAEPSDENLAAFQQAFRDALSNGDFETVAASFARDARVFEGGKAESSLEGYLEHHLKPEMPMLTELNRDVISKVIYRHGEAGWASIEARLWGAVGEREIDSSHVETMNFVFVHGGWKIAHVHWSSRRNKKD